VTKAVADEYLSPLLRKGIDTLVLGCTHYPLLKKTIRAKAGPRIRLIDSAEATAAQVWHTLQIFELASGRKQRGKYRFYVSDAPQKFETIGTRFLDCPVAPVSRVDLEEI
jgi:glutamate racemase